MNEETKAGGTTSMGAAKGSSCSIKPTKPFRDPDGTVHLTRLTNKSG